MHCLAIKIRKGNESNTVHPTIDGNTLKAESQHFKLIVIILFHIHCAAVQSQNNEKCVTVLLPTDCTALG